MRRIALLSMALCFGTGGSGCQTLGPASLSALAQPAVTVTGYTYSGGRAVQSFALPPKNVEPAALAAMDDLRIHSVRRISEEGSIVLEGTTPDNRRASMTIHPQNAGTRVSTRLGFFGDEPLSRALMDRISVRLGTLPPAAVSVDPPASEPGKNPYFSRAAVSDSEMFKDQADAQFRSKPDDIAQLKVRSDKGEMIPLSSLMRVKDSYGPDRVQRYNALQPVGVR